MLMTRGASALDRTSDGWTALMLAADSGNLPMVKFLVDEGGDIQAKNNQGRTALIFAAREGHVEVVRYLLSKGARKDDGPVMETPMSVAFHKARTGVVRELMRSGASIIVDPGQGITALHVAACMNFLDIARVLLEEGCHETIKTTVTRVPPAAFIGKPVGISESERDHPREACMRRLLARGPAFRAVSWLWPAEDSPVEERSQGTCSGDCGTTEMRGAASRQTLSPPGVTWLPHPRRQGRPRPTNLPNIFYRYGSKSDELYNDQNFLEGPDESSQDSSGGDEGKYDPRGEDQGKDDPSGDDQGNQQNPNRENKSEQDQHDLATKTPDP